jgi:hypothetical protein
VRDAGVTEIENSGRGETISVAPMAWVGEPAVPVPVMVSAEVPAGVEVDVVTLSVEDELAGLGLNDAEAPAGNPLTLRFTVSAKPFDPVIVTP